MAHTSIRTVSGITDAQIKALFVLLGQNIQQDPIFTVVGLPGNLDPNDERLNKLIRENADVIKSATLSGRGFHVSYQARVFAHNEQGHTTPHPYYSIIVVNLSDSNSYNETIPKPDEEGALNCNLQIGKFLKKHQLNIAGIVKDNGNLLEPHLALISKIEASSAEQISRTNEHFVELTERFDARNAHLNDQIDIKRSELEADHAAKLAQLEEDRQNLASERKDLDDRTNTHARRAIRGELITTLQSRQTSFAISKDTKSLRWPIHAIFIFLIVSTFSGAAWSLYVWGINPSDTYGAIAVTSAIKSVVFTFGFLTTAGLYVSWMNRWFDKHADAQFQTKQFEIDINRASWAVEAALEWKGAQGEHMPDVLLSGITKHLFEISAAESTEYSPLEALATSILGAASNLNLDVNGNRVTLDRKSIKEIKKSGS